MPMPDTQPSPSLRAAAQINDERLRSIGLAARGLATAFEADDVENFSRNFFFGASSHDLDVYTDELLARAALSQWELGRTRLPGAPLIRVENHESRTRIGARTVIDIVNDDMPFLISSVLADLAEHEIGVRMLVHPIFLMRRGNHGQRLSLGRRDDDGAIRESHIHIETDFLAESSACEMLTARLSAILADVRAAVTDWRAMLARLNDAMTELRTNPNAGPQTEEAEAFLHWLQDNNFTFLGARNYRYVGATAGGTAMQEIAESGLGLLRDPQVHVLRRADQLNAIAPEALHFLRETDPLIITKANIRSRVHRRVLMDYIGVKRFDEGGTVVGEVRFVGLFTSTAYNRSARAIPLLNGKVQRTLERTGLRPDSHDGKAIINILETFPRDELFQISEDDLLNTTLGILRLHERPHTGLFVRHDRFGRFVSVLVFIPRDRFGMDLAGRITHYLCKAFDGHISDVFPQFTESPLVRLHFIVVKNTPSAPEPDESEITAIEIHVAEMSRGWRDHLARALLARHEPAEAAKFLFVYGTAFPQSFTNMFSAYETLDAITLIESLRADNDIGIAFYRPRDGAGDSLNLRLYRRGAPIPLSERVPLLENLGLKVIDEFSYEIRPLSPDGKGRDVVWMHDMSMHSRSGAEMDVEQRVPLLDDALRAIWTAIAANDGLNALTLNEGIAWRDVVIFRLCSKYMQQLGVAFSQNYICATLCANSAITAKLLRLFYARFDPDMPMDMPERQGLVGRISTDIEEALGAVASLDEDRILRRFRNLIESALRTNFFMRDEDGEFPAAVAIKFASGQIDEMPLPRPHVEIFVYSPRVEGVHLRGGKIARGGIRWSDRHEDFRTEILGLVKAQNVKNAVIVPVGAKGGFVPKRLPTEASRDDIQNEAIACYKLFISSLLGLTDNLVEGQVIPPERVLRYDDDDPYLVVAADKGTATFSDIANGIAVSRRFWLGDAFASGGSEGYDHKKMGITARGAWEAVKRHFREMDIDIQSEPFSVVGVGDMSGDVFGNGMLLSRKIHLIAAFDHRDIFIDPQPDPEISYAERQRLFNLPRSSWKDYNAQLISAGGGVFPRQAKQISISPQMRDVLSLQSEHATPNEIVRAILRCDCDLLWFGGIGTFIKCESESDAQVGDRVNDIVRANAGEVRAKVIGEGANLGVTQKGRISYARDGGRINTDAIDNSAGVNTSDYEVNIKIALSAAREDNKISREERSAILSELEPEVGSLVLRNNYLQTLCLSMAQARAGEQTAAAARLMRFLEQENRLNRQIEYLPPEQRIAEMIQAGESLTRPELAVLMSYAKIDLFNDLIASDVPEGSYLSRDLMRYFPKALQDRLPECIAHHKLRREIISTMLSNSLVNRGGPTFVHEIIEETKASLGDVARAYATARESYGILDLLDEINDLDNKIPSAVQMSMYMEVQELLRGQTLWFLRNAPRPLDILSTVGRFRPGVAEIFSALSETVYEAGRRSMMEKTESLTEARVPSATARHVAALRILAQASDIVEAAGLARRPIAKAADVHFALGEKLSLFWLRRQAEELKIVDHFERLAVNHLLHEIALAHRRLVVAVLPFADDLPAQEAVDKWFSGQPTASAFTALAREIEASGVLSLAKLAIAASQLGEAAGRE
jgi:glutamate dehydrogenase